MILTRLLFYNLVSNNGINNHNDPNPVIIISALVFPLILFSLYFFYLKYRQKHKIIEWLGKKEPDSYSDFVFKEIQIVLAVAMIKRDRYLLINKLKRMKQFAQRNYSPNKLDVEEILEVFLEEKIPVMDLIEWCNKQVSYTQKLETFLFLSEISLMDEQLAFKEKEYLLFIIQRFSILNQDIPEKIQDHVFERQQQKKSIKQSVFSYQFHYEVLGLKKDASVKDIKDAYRKLVKKFHPDSHPDLGEDAKKELAEKFQEVQEAYDALMNA
jgi:hypothetical protein